MRSLLMNSMYANTNGNMKFKRCSCPCNVCISSNYDRCSEQIHCGEWVNYEMQAHLDYDSIPLKPHLRKRRHQE